MTNSLELIVPAVIGGICLLTVCGVYLWKQSFNLGGMFLSVSGVVLLGLSNWEPQSDEALSDLIPLLGEIRAARTGQEAQLGQIIRNQEQMAALLGGLDQTHASTLRAPEAETETAAGDPERLPPGSLEIEALGGISNGELDAIVAWVKDVKSEHPASVLFIDPVMPHASYDLDGQRRRLMNEAGRVIDHVFKEMRRTIGVASLRSENVPGPLLRLRFEASPARQRDRFGPIRETQASSLPMPSPGAADTWRGTSSASLEPTADQALTRPGSREAIRNPEQESEPQGNVEWAEDGSVVITFPVNSSYFPPGARHSLDSLVAPMTSGAPYRIELHGGLSGSDKVRGTTEPEEAMRYNKWLAERRISRVEEWLIKNAQGRQLEIEPKFVVEDNSRRVVIRAMPTI